MCLSDCVRIISRYYRLWDFEGTEYFFQKFVCMQVHERERERESVCFILLSYGLHLCRHWWVSIPEVIMLVTLLWTVPPTEWPHKFMVWEPHRGVLRCSMPMDL